jgi:hypothetical protein
LGELLFFCILYFSKFPHLYNLALKECVGHWKIFRELCYCRIIEKTESQQNDTRIMSKNKINLPSNFLPVVCNNTDSCPRWLSGEISDLSPPPSWSAESSGTSPKPQLVDIYPSQVNHLNQYKCLHSLVTSCS